MEFTSLLFLKTKEKGKEILHLGPWTSISSHRGCLAGLGNRGGAGGRNPAWGLTGGVGEVGEKLHGVERNSGMGSVGARDGRSGGSAKSSGRRWRFAAAAAVRWSGAMASGSGSTGGGQGS